MNKLTLKQITRTAKNNGIHKEQTYEFTKVGTISNHDNKPFWLGGDVGDVQVKSSRATVCKGYDIRKHVEMDGATSYAYVNETATVAYEMNATEYIAFVEMFSIKDRESGKNGGAEKLRLKKENKKMVEWLESLSA